MAQNDTPDRSAEIDGLFAAAKRHHQAGQLGQAEPLYRQVLSIRPAHLGALNFLAVLAQQQGKPEAAIELLTRAISINAQVSDLHSNLAEAYEAVGRVDAAIDHYRQALEIEPDFSEARCSLAHALRRKGDLVQAIAQFREAIALSPKLAQAHHGLGLALHQQGHTSDAIGYYRQVLALDPNHADACNNLGIALSELGEHTESIAQFQRAIAIRPNFAAAHTHLGNALREQGRIDEALAHCRRAIALEPDSAEGLHNLAAALLVQGQPQQALGPLRRALEIRERPESKLLFVSCLSDGTSPEPNLRPILLRALTEAWGRPVDLAAACTQIVKLTPAVMAGIERASKIRPVPFPAPTLFGPADFKAIAGDALLLRMLEITPVCDADIERLLSVLRLHLLQWADATSPSDDVDAAVLEFCAALAQQCFINQYVFVASEAEGVAAKKLRDRLDTALASHGPLSMLWLVASACYHPLHTLPNAERLKGRSWPNALQRLVRRQVTEPQEERRLANEMRQLTPVADRVSLEVQRQYEESPYPTWVVNPKVPAQRSILGFLRSQFPFAPVRTAEASGPLSILIAGCGTGRHSIEVAQQFPDTRVLAIDLSLASLAYAQRKTVEAGIRNIEYAHADILGLGAISDRFDMIQSSGVLHHLHDPMLGWRTLVGLLKPHGIMHIGLYSRLARDEVTAARTLIASHGYRDTPDDIRRCRQDLLATKHGMALPSITSSPDFSSTSACRDLLFHVQEHQMTLPQIASFLAEQRLQFLGFALEPRTLERYRRRFPSDRSATNLANWHTFETENPNTFAAMYQFWVQRNW